MSQNESTTFLVTDAKNLTLIDATRENSPWWVTIAPHLNGISTPPPTSTNHHPPSPNTFKEF